MAYCANCGHQISDLATSCPRCGHPNEAGTGVATDLAGFWLRFAAVFLDGLILAVPGILVGLVVAASTFSFQSFMPGPRYGGFGFFSPFSFIGYVLGFTYNWLMLGLNNGQTVGKMVCGIRIMRPNRTPIDMSVAATRAGMAIVSGLPLNLGYLWAAWDPEKRTWHDMVAGTRAFRVTR